MTYPFPISANLKYNVYGLLRNIGNILNLKRLLVGVLPENEYSFLVGYYNIF
jgi:hypothetical protein